jgi:hypothetical protein
MVRTCLFPAVIALAGCTVVADFGDPECQGQWYDSANDLTWQDPPAASTLDWSDAMTYCDLLSCGGVGPGGWHLPSKDELESLVRGPHAGCYWPEEISGDCGYYWSSLGGPDSASNAWGVYFSSGYGDTRGGWVPSYVRCVRRGP